MCPHALLSLVYVTRCNPYVTSLPGGTETKKGRFGKEQESIPDFIQYNGTFDPWRLGSVPQ